MDKNRVKITKQFDNRTETGYYDHRNRFILHSFDNEPAIIWGKGCKECKEWYRDGLLHRESDLPTIEGIDGYKVWLKDGSLHRDGNKPARIFSDGGVEYWLEGKRYYPDQKLPEYTLNQLKEKVGHDFKLIIEVK